jgi:lipoate-protein ligase A
MSIAQERWRLLPFSAGPAGNELALGEALLAGLAHTAAPAVRWYGARARALVIGSGQRPTDVDGAALAAAGVSLHKRGSGGTAVLFTPGFLMQDIALPAGHRLARPDVSESYRWLGEVWAAALAALGVPTELVSIAAARADTAAADPLVRRACFGGRSPYELLAGGRKLVGFSQIRRRQGALLQVGVYAAWPGRELAALLRLPDPERGLLEEALAARVAGLDELLPAAPEPAAIQAAFAGALARLQGAALEPAAWREDELAGLAAGLARFGPLDLAATIPPTASS